MSTRARCGRASAPSKTSSYRVYQGFVDCIGTVTLCADYFAVTTDVVIGESVAEQITDYASREQCDLISIATHGRGGLSRMMRGSVGDAVMRSARTCVLVFHPSKTGVEHGVDNAALFGRASTSLVPA